MTESYQLGLYAVPNPDNVSGGPRTRIMKMAEVFKQNNSANHVIVGRSSEKLKKAILASKMHICYVESATNRIKLVDLLCLLILRMKTRYMVIYIRDVYQLLFPNIFTTLKRRVSKMANTLSNYFFLKIADKLAFPTEEMGMLYTKSYKSKIPYFALPPGTFSVEHSNTSNIEMKTENKIKKISFLYLGGTEYEYSGIMAYYDLIDSLGDKFEFHILTGNQIQQDLKNRGVSEKVQLHSVSHEEVLNYIEKHKISFLIHSRPRNEYDDLTYPIKIMDCISVGLPIITLRHKPIEKLLGKNYKFFVPEISKNELKKLIKNRRSLFESYSQTLIDYQELCSRSSYKKQLEKIIDNF